MDNRTAMTILMGWLNGVYESEPLPTRRHLDIYRGGPVFLIQEFPSKLKPLGYNRFFMEFSTLKEAAESVNKEFSVS